jgi:hypothetical protein
MQWRAEHRCVLVFKLKRVSVPRLTVAIHRSSGQCAASLWVLLTLLLVLSLPFSTKAQTVQTVQTGQTGDFSWKQLDTIITITGYSGTNSAVAIPDTINDLSVTRIGAHAFNRCSWVTSVAIPGSVTNIGDVAFGGCSKLSAITVDFNNPVFSSIGGVLFDKNQTTLIIYPCGGGASSYTVSNSVVSIGNRAFFDCSSLTNIDIGNTVTSIGDHAFSYCSNLASMNIPSSVASIGIHAFLDCSQLTAITVDSNNSYFSSVGGVLFDKNQTTLIAYPCNGTNSYTIPNDVVSIGDYAFFNRANLTSVVIPSSVVSIGILTFDFCSNLTNIVIGSSVAHIGIGAFYRCSRLTSVIIPSSVTNIGNSAFVYCTNLTGIYFQGNAPSVSTDVTVFNGITNTTVYYLAGTTGWGATFDGLPTALLPFAFTTTNGAITITGYTGSNNTVVIPSAIYGLPVTRIETNAFDNCSNLFSVTISDSVTNIGSQAFFCCYNLTNVVIGNSVTNIGNSAFYGCYGLGGIVIPHSVINIGEDVFVGCEGLTNVVIGEGVVSIGDYAFGDCPDLSTVTIPASVASIHGSAFAKCKLTEINVEPGNAFFSSVDGVLFDLNQTTLVAYPFYGSTFYSVPDGVTNIADGAFSGCSWLTDITLPDSLTHIGQNAFDSSGLTGVALPNSVYSIGKGAFASCANLSSIAIPNGVTRIENFVFFDCEALTNVVLGSSVAYLGDDAFGFCNSLESVYCLGNAPAVADNEFTFESSYPTLYYLAGTTGWENLFCGRPTAVWTFNSPTLSVQYIAPNIVLTWPSGVLLESTNLDDGGSWTTNSDAQSPYTVTPDGSRKFYRVQFAAP